MTKKDTIFAVLTGTYIVAYLLAVASGTIMVDVPHFGIGG